MAKTTADSYIERNYNVIIIAVTIVVLGGIFMFFRDRQQKRLLQLDLIDTRMDTWEDLRPQQQNTQTVNSGERIL
ncbi:MAG: hypothetical protein ACYSWW_03915 [Planctomycetota bacterium]|jgi:hypothetical protein